MPICPYPATDIRASQADDAIVEMSSGSAICEPCFESVLRIVRSDAGRTQSPHHESKGADSALSISCYITPPAMTCPRTIGHIKGPSTWRSPMAAAFASRHLAPAYSDASGPSSSTCAAKTPATIASPAAGSTLPLSSSEICEASSSYEIQSRKHERQSRIHGHEQAQPEQEFMSSIREAKRILYPCNFRQPWHWHNQHNHIKAAGISLKSTIIFLH